MAHFLPFILGFCLLQGADSAELIGKYRSAFAKGDGKAALAVAEEMVKKQPDGLGAYFARARAFSLLDEHDKAIADFTKMIALDKEGISPAYSNRGGEYFKVGKIKESIADFDKEIKLNPQAEENHWRRGISLYYADSFEDGAKQFELGKRVYGNDVENAFWHFLCLARKEGLEKARSQLLDVKNDSRYYMPKVMEMIAGKAKPEEVIAVVDKSEEKDKTEGYFYANLYVGLYYEASGEAKKGLEYIKTAVNKYKIGHYMYAVAKVHVQLREKK